MNNFFSVIRSYLLDYLPKQKCCSEKTIQSHKHALNLLVSFIRTQKGIKVDKITFEIIDRQVVIDFLNWLEDTRNCCVATRNQRLSILRSFFSHAGSLDCTKVELELSVKKIPKKQYAQEPVDFLSENALKVLLEQPNINKLNGIRDRFFMMLMYDTAARCSEMLELRICDLRIKNAKPIVYLDRKGGKKQALPLMSKTVEHCKHYIKIFHPNANDLSEDYLFYTIRYGEKHSMSNDAVGAFIKKYGISAKKVCSEIPERVHPHQLRHTRAIHFYRKGMPLALVGEYLGHATLETTKIYAYADTEMKRKAMEKADSNITGEIEVDPMWKDDEDMILRLSGLK